MPLRICNSISISITFNFIIFIGVFITFKGIVWYIIQSQHRLVRVFHNEVLKIQCQIFLYRKQSIFLFLICGFDLFNNTFPSFCCITRSIIQRTMPHALSIDRLIWLANSSGLNCCEPRMT